MYIYIYVCYVFKIELLSTVVILFLNKKKIRRINYEFNLDDYETRRTFIISITCSLAPK